VEETTSGFPAPDGDPAAQALESLRRETARNLAVVTVRDGTDAAARLGRRAESDDEGRLTLHYTDLQVLADELASFGPEVLVHKPPALVDAVRERLEHVAAAHGGEDG
ncbi:MAG TPA: WYL domain-containing protein, partial [Amnibacterium sp.]|nr:WYL domain-containing protein [Amnibacterium sp.]